MVLDHTLHKSAEEDLQEALNYYQKINPELSRAIVKEFELKIREIKRNPLLFESAGKTYRKANLIRFPYKIIFKIKKNEILIVAFAHHKRKPNYWKMRK